MTVLGLTVTPPPSWNIQTGSALTTANISNVQRLSDVESSSSSMESLFQLQQLRGVNSARLPMEQWFDNYFTNGFDGPIWSRTSIIVGGRPALRVETSGLGRWVHVFVGSGADVVEISYEISKTAFVGQYESMLQSIRFMP